MRRVKVPQVTRAVTQNTTICRCTLDIYSRKKKFRIISDFLTLQKFPLNVSIRQNTPGMVTTDITCQNSLTFPGKNKISLTK